MDYYTRALELKDETIAHRRYIHQNAEIGLDLPKTTAYVLAQLKSLGIEPEMCGHGITATIGQGSKTILLRADMDALPMQELSGEAFACPSGAAHACGHDFHAAMLLTAAKMLKENETSLKGTVKLMFQPAEECFSGSTDMIKHGILADPAPDVALAYHVSPGRLPVGLYMYNSKGTMMNSVDGFKITITGKGCHGAYPHYGVDPINIGVHIHLALQSLIAREANPNDASVLTIGQFTAGTAANIIPETAVLQGTLRTDSVESRKLLLKRIKEVCEQTAQMYNGHVEIETLSAVPPLITDSVLSKEIASFMQELPIPHLIAKDEVSASASEDFALIAEKIPTAFMFLASGFMDERGEYPSHHPKALFNEDVCPIGAASFAHSATRWLEIHA